MEKQLKHLVSVYGSLLKARGNHGVIGRYIPEGKAKLLGESLTPDIFSMYDLGSYPGLETDGVNRIHTEVYALDDEAFASVRMLEGYREDGKGLYNETEVDTKWGKSIIYIYNFGFSGSPMPPNPDNIVNWNTHYVNKMNFKYVR